MPWQQLYPEHGACFRERKYHGGSRSSETETTFAKKTKKYLIFIINSSASFHSIFNYSSTTKRNQQTKKPPPNSKQKATKSTATIARYTQTQNQTLCQLVSCYLKNRKKILHLGTLNFQISLSKHKRFLQHFHVAVILASTSFWSSYEKAQR